MKILISNDGPTANFFIRRGYARAFHACGHDVCLWEISDKPIYDIFDEFKPDLFMGQTYNLKPSWIKCIRENPLLKVILKGSDWGEQQKEIDLNKYPILVANSTEIDLVRQLTEETDNLQFIHGHYHPNRIQSTHGYWQEKIGVKVVGLMSGADIFDFSGGQFREEFASDIAFVGGYWGYKAQTLNQYIVPLCQLDTPYRIKIFGNQGWPIPQYCGFLPDEVVKDVLASATICPNISEPHSQVYGTDIVERPWKLLSNKCFCISDYVESMAKDVFTNDEIVFVNNPKEFYEKIEYYIKNPDKRLPYIERGFRTVIDNHTYFSRVKTIFENCNLPNEVVKVDEAIKQMKEKIV